MGKRTERLQEKGNRKRLLHKTLLQLGKKKDSREPVRGRWLGILFPPDSVKITARDERIEL